MKSLVEMKEKEISEVIEVRGTIPIRLRLADMGIRKGTKVKFLRKAPLGDPIEIEVKGTFLSLRKEEARSIFVKD